MLQVRGGPVFFFNFVGPLEGLSLTFHSVQWAIPVNKDTPLLRNSNYVFRVICTPVILCSAVKRYTVLSTCTLLSAHVCLTTHLRLLSSPSCTPLISRPPVSYPPPLDLRPGQGEGADRERDDRVLPDLPVSLLHHRDWADQCLWRPALHHPQDTGREQRSGFCQIILHQKNFP